MSTSYHLQIDVQSEKTIQTLEIMLRVYWTGKETGGSIDSSRVFLQ